MTILLAILIMIVQKSISTDEIDSCKSSVNFYKISQSILCDHFLISSLQNLLETMKKFNKYLVHKTETFKDYKEEACILPKLNESNVSCPKRSKYSSCKNAIAKNGPGVYLIDPIYVDIKPLMVYCEADLDGGLPWIVIQRRLESDITLTLMKHNYIKSFGGPYSNYWMGLEKIHKLTTNYDFELWIQFVYRNGHVKNAKYNHFGLGSRSQNYNLLFLGNYTGDAGDGLRASVGYAFSTAISRRDDFKLNCNEFDGGWWYGKDNCEKHLHSAKPAWLGKQENFAKIQMAIREKPRSLQCS